jgi:hypothetical protein
MLPGSCVSAACALVIGAAALCAGVAGSPGVAAGAEVDGGDVGVADGAAVAAGAGVVDGGRAGGAPGPACAHASLAVYEDAAIVQATPAMKMETRIFTKDLHPMTVDI